MKNILLAEDDPFIRDNLMDLLTELGFNVTVAVNGLEALEKVNICSPHIIISDVRMPKMDGIKFRKEILKSEKTKKIPFLYISALNNKDNVLGAHDLGKYDVIPKPYKIDDIVNLVVKKYGSL
ncbi:MAG: response regulator [Melioribacteraceae bacterium]|nr:response regulator [Melioribacteraceae bacterium]